MTMIGMNPSHVATLGEELTDLGGIVRMAAEKIHTAFQQVEWQGQDAEAFGARLTSVVGTASEIAERALLLGSRCAAEASEQVSTSAH